MQILPLIFYSSAQTLLEQTVKIALLGMQRRVMLLLEITSLNQNT